jgi:hypothetical protein
MPLPAVRSCKVWNEYSDWLAGFEAFVDARITLLNQ